MLKYDLFISCCQLLLPINAKVLNRRWKKVTTGCLILQGFSRGCAGENVSPSDCMLNISLNPLSLKLRYLNLTAENHCFECSTSWFFTYSLFS